MGKLWEKSGSLELDNNGRPAAGAVAYFFSGGTTTPLTVYEDSAESTAHAVPVEADGNGRWPLVDIPFVVSYDVKVQTSGGTQLYYYREIPNPDPVDVAAGAVTTTSSQINQTGDVKWRPNSGSPPSGWVRMNGRTIGSATSGASERANADVADLYAYLWNNFADSILAVTTGRGATAVADFAANKPIALFDLRGGSPLGLDDMGNTAASRFGSWPFGTGNATTGGSFGGENTHVLTTGELATHLHGFGTIAAATESAHTHSGTTAGEAAHTHGAGTFAADSGGAHTHGLAKGSAFSAALTSLTSSATSANGTGNDIASDGAHTHTISGTSAAGSIHTHTFTTGAGVAHTHTMSGSTANAGSGTAHNIVSLGILGIWIMKL